MATGPQSIKDYSPFTPGVPVPVELFAGRETEVAQLVHAAKKSADTGSLERLFVVGERGIGKSSLCKYARVAALKEARMLGAHVFLGGVKTLDEMVRRILEKILKDSIDKACHNQILEFFGDKIKQVGLFGVTLEIDASKKELSRFASDFAPAMKNLLKKLQPDYKGLMLILDDINGLANNEDFANWIKSLVDEMATEDDQLSLTLVLVGLSERRDAIIQNQPSVNRIFDIIQVERIDTKSTQQFYFNAFNQLGVVVAEDALSVLSILPGGYPALMQELGDAVHKADTDGAIDAYDVANGFFAARKIVGEKYLGEKILEALSNKRYLSIFKALYNEDRPALRYSFKRKDIYENVSVKEKKVIDTFLRRMVELGVLVRDRSIGKGYYKFTNRLFMSYIHMIVEGVETKSI